MNVLRRASGFGALITLAATLAGCVNGQPVRGGGLPDSVDVTAMFTSWKSGRCATSGRGWGGFDHGMNLPSGSPAPAGQSFALLPDSVDRILICQFSAESSALTGSALLTNQSSVSRLTSDINAAKTVNAGTCTGTSRAMLLAGHGVDVASIDVDEGGCTVISGGNEVGDYGGTSLAADINAAITAR